MVHPVGLTGKTTHSLSDIMTALTSLIFREYNKDATYRDPQDKPLLKVHKGEPAGINDTPAAAVSFDSADYEDAPQDAGADIELHARIICYGNMHGAEAQQDEAIRMAEAIRHILLDNKQVPNASGTEQVYQIGYRKMRIVFDQ